MVFCWLVFGPCAHAFASGELDDWRNKAAAVRLEAENDVIAAQKASRNLEAILPADAGVGERTLLLNLNARIEIYLGRLDEAEAHVRAALAQAQQGGDKVGEAEAYLSLSLLAVHRGRTGELMEVTPLALEALQGVTGRPDLLGEAMLRLAMMHRRIGRFDDFATLCAEAMDIAQRSSVPLALIYAYHGLSIASEQSGRFAESKDYLSRMLALAREKHLRQIEGEALASLGHTLANLGEWGAAEASVKEAVAQFGKTGSPFSFARGQFVLADMLRTLGRPSDALGPLASAIAVYEQFQSKSGLWWSLNARSENLQALRRIGEAEADAERAYGIARSIDVPSFRADSARRLASVKADEGDYPEAYRYSMEAAEISDALMREKSSRRIAELAQMFRTESKQRQIDDLTVSQQRDMRERHQLWILLAVAGAALLLVAYLLLRLRRSHNLLAASHEQLQQSRREIELLNFDLERRVQSRSDALRRQASYLQSLIDTLPFYVWLKDTEGRCITVNNGGGNPAHGVCRRDVPGKTVAEVLPGELGQRLFDADREVGTTLRRKSQEVCVTNDDGTQSWWEIDKAPVLDEGGRLLGSVGAARDISERKRMEEELSARERSFRTLAENAPDNIIRYDREGRVQYLNPVMQRTLGVEPEALLGKAFAELPDIGIYLDKLNQVLGSGESCEFELEIPLPPEAGGPRVHHIRMVAERCENGDLTGVLAIGRDITEIKRYETAREAALAEAVRLAKLRSEFLAHMSHELRTPLNGILGYSQILRNDRDLQDRHDNALKVILESGEHLLLLIDDVLDLTRIETGRLELAANPVALPALLRMVVDMFDVKAKQKGLAFRCDFASDLPAKVLGDETRLRQILLNLLDNAVKFTERGGVTLRIERGSGERLVFSVEDSGVGVAREELELIFQPFEQTRNYRHRLGGTGLGLAICRQLARMMGGDIAVESRFGAGSTFRVEVPLPVVEGEAEWPVLAGKRCSFRAASEEQQPGAGIATALTPPPREEMQILHGLAQRGNMRDIIGHCEHIAGLSRDYHEFAAHLRQLAESYQSKAILNFVEHYLPDPDSHDSNS